MANNKDFKVKNGIQPTVYHEGLGTVTSSTEEYNLANASYDNKSFSVASQETAPVGLSFKSDGTKMYTVGNNKAVYQYSLSTAWDISTASYDSVSFSVGTQITNMGGLSFNDDGTKMYASEANTGIDGEVYQYTLSTAWDVSTASYDSVSLNTDSQDFNPLALFWRGDGSSFYIAGAQNDTLYQYTVSTAYDLSTASYASKSLAVGTQVTVPTGLFIKSDGTALFVTDGTSDAIYQYNLSTAWDISTGSYSGISFSVTSQDTNPRNLFFKPDGLKLYVVGITNDTVYQYSTVLNTETLNLSTGSVFEITPTSDIQINLSNPADSGTVSQATLLLDGAAASTYDLANAVYDSKSFSVSGQEAIPTGVTFNTNGTKMFICGSNGVEVNEYALSTAWDISTASYTTNFSVASQDTAPEDITFKTDGTKMFMVGRTSDAVYQYSLSTAYDISTASYDSVSLSISSQDTFPTGLRFSSDGTKLFVIGDTTNTIYQYGLTTAWDLSTASYASKSFSVGTQDANPASLAFNSDGTKLFIIGRSTRDAFQYTLSTAWDISTASYDSITFVLENQPGDPAGMAFSADGTKMYVVDYNTDLVYQYSTAISATITYPSTLEWPSGTAPTSPDIGDTDVITFSTTDGGTTYQAVQAIDGAS